MSLADSIFIFVLALIIFGPKKLPEMAKQLGRLVGEFRRASNEFKFQIEEELRQSEMQDRQKIATSIPTAEEPTILPPALPASSQQISPRPPIGQEAEPGSASLTATPPLPVVVPAVGAEPRDSIPAGTSKASPIEPAYEVETPHD